MASANVELVRRGFVAALRGEFDVVAELLDPNVIWHGGDPASGCRNREQTLAWMRRAAGRGPVRLVDVADAGQDQVVVVLQPQPEAGGVTPSPRANVTTVRDGRVTEMVAFETPEEAWAWLNGRGDRS